MLIYKRASRIALTQKSKLINTRQHNKGLLEYTGYMFRPVKSSSSLQQSKSQVLF